MPERQRLDLKERARYISINPDETEAIIRDRKLNILSIRRSSTRRLDMSDGFFSSEEVDDVQANQPGKE